MEIPTLESVTQVDWTVQKRDSRSGFLKNLTVESFGVGSAPTRQAFELPSRLTDQEMMLRQQLDRIGEGFEFPLRLTDGPFTSFGLECPRCVIRPTTDRIRPTLPPFGSQATLSLWRNRARMFTGIGGINAFRTDNVTIEPGSSSCFQGGSFRRDSCHGGWRRDSSFNDAWLAQGWAGGKIAVDPDRRIWLGVVGRYLSNVGAGKQHWNTFAGCATFQLAH